MNNVKIVAAALAVVTEMPHNPVMNQFKRITEELLHAHFRGTIVFDLVVSQGLEGRFVQATFDGVQIERKSLQVMDSSKVPMQVVKAQNQFFSNNYNLLKSTMLSSSEINQLV